MSALVFYHVFSLTSSLSNLLCSYRVCLSSLCVFTCFLFAHLVWNWMNFQVSKEKCSFLLYTIWRNSKFSCPVRFGVTMVIARRFTLLIATVGSNCQEKAVLAKLLNRLPVKVGARLWLSFKQISRRPFFFFYRSWELIANCFLTVCFVLRGFSALTYRNLFA